MNMPLRIGVVHPFTCPFSFTASQHPAGMPCTGATPTQSSARALPRRQPAHTTFSFFLPCSRLVLVGVTASPGPLFSWTP